MAPEGPCGETRSPKGLGTTVLHVHMPPAALGNHMGKVQILRAEPFLGNHVASLENIPLFSPCSSHPPREWFGSFLSMAVQEITGSGVLFYC